MYGMTFRDLGLSAPILTALEEQGYQKPSPIQEKAIPPALTGRDVLGCAQTGTGKTCAFAVPILQRLSEVPAKQHFIRALVLTPTRELAIQIGESFTDYGKHLKLRHTVIYGGVGQNPQVEALKKGVDILVATPGRLMDLYNQGFISLMNLEIFVLDEADRMLDMGFIHDVEKILKWLPAQKQTLFFSATMPPEITDLVNSLLKNPVRVAVNPVSSPVEAIRQSVYLVDKANKTKLLAHLMAIKAAKSALVFTRTKHGANKVARDLEKAGISAAAIHGNKSQTARQQALADFKTGKLRCLVATDIAARGLDIEDLALVFNYNLPEVPETYVHRIGRTGRAGRGGEAIAFCDFSEQPLLREIETLIGKKIPRVEENPFPMEVFEVPKRDKHGRVVNEEDAEARAAAREQRRRRDEAKQAAAREKRLAEQVETAHAVKILEGKERTHPTENARRKKKKPTNVQPTEVTLSPRTPTQTRRPRQTRSGTPMDTGAAMPRTDLYHPNPLDSDVVMDAPARLLAPRRSAASGAQETERPAKPNRRKKKRPVVQPTQSVEVPKRSSQKKASQSPAGKERTRQNTSRRSTQEPRRSQHKDSTEQPSLMKPYYLDIGR
jgi:ATP-dependent RNA helicase RhlE